MTHKNNGFQECNATTKIDNIGDSKMVNKKLTSNEILSALCIQDEHAGTAIGTHWLASEDLLTSVCPTNAEVLGNVQQSTNAQLDMV